MSMASLIVRQAKRAAVRWPVGGLYSATPAYTSWTPSASTITRQAALSPDRQYNGMTVVEDTATSTHGTVIIATLTIAAVSYVLTSWVRRVVGGRDVGVVVFNSATSADITAVVDLGSGAVLTAPTITGGFFSLASLRVTKARRGWFKIELSFTSSADTGNWMIYRLAAVTNMNYAGDGLSSLAVWGTDFRAGPA